MTVSRQRFVPVVLCGGAIAALLFIKNAPLLPAGVLGMLLAAVVCTIVSANRQKTLTTQLEQQVEARTLQLQDSMAELEELSSLQDLLLYAISHDLRTTVMGSLMVLENLQGQAGDIIPVPRELLRRMSQSGKTQLHHLNQLLEAYGNMTEGITLQKSWISITAILQETIADLLPLLQDHDITLINPVSVEPIWVMADVEKMRQVFHQLISNAAKHNPPGIELRLEATLTVSAKQPVERPVFQFTIMDNGIGIDPVEQKSLFELRLRPSQERQLTRISLGLCLCKQIITAHGGQIAVHSQLGEGTRIWFTLPLER
jgi:signal transduction histidine kinase